MCVCVGMIVRQLDSQTADLFSVILKDEGSRAAETELICVCVCSYVPISESQWELVEAATLASLNN